MITYPSGRHLGARALDVAFGLLGPFDVPDIFGDLAVGIKGGAFASYCLAKAFALETGQNESEAGLKALVPTVGSVYLSLSNSAAELFASAQRRCLTCDRAYQPVAGDIVFLDTQGVGMPTSCGIAASYAEGLVCVVYCHAGVVTAEAVTVARVHGYLCWDD